MESTDSNIFRLIVCGKTGAGKSTVLNHLALGMHDEGQKLFREGDDYKSITSEIRSQIRHFKNDPNNFKVEFVDTPGFFDTEKRDTDHLIMLCKFLKSIPDGFNIILFCFPAGEIRLDESLQQSMKLLGTVMGKAVYENIFIVQTMLNMVVDEQAAASLLNLKNEIIPFFSKNGMKLNKKIIQFDCENEQNDGLDEIKQLLTDHHNKFKPQILEDVKQIFDENNPEESINKLLCSSAMM